MPRRDPLSELLDRPLSSDEKRNYAFQMRLAGATYEEIAEAIGWRSKATAHEAINGILAELAPRQEDADLMRAEMHERLMTMLRSRWAQAVEEGDDKAYELVLKTISHVNKLYGLERPLQITTKVEKEVTSIDEEIRALCEAMGAQAPISLDD